MCSRIRCEAPTEHTTTTLPPPPHHDDTNTTTLPLQRTQLVPVPAHAHLLAVAQRLRLARHLDLQRGPVGGTDAVQLHSIGGRCGRAGGVGAEGRRGRQGSDPGGGGSCMVAVQLHLAGAARQACLR